MSGPENCEISGDFCYFVIENVLRASESGRVHAGDLFVTHGGLNFVRYKSFMSPGCSAAKKGLAFAIGGLAGMAATGVADGFAETNAYQYARKKRVKQWGRSVSDRHPAVVIDRHSITKIEISDHGFKVVCGDVEHSFGLNIFRARHRRQLRNYVDGEVSAERDKHGVNVGMAPPENFVSSLVGGKPLDLQEIDIDKMVDHPLYMGKFWDRFYELRSQDKEKAIKSMSLYSGKVFERLHQSLLMKVDATRRLIILKGVSVFLMLGVFVLWTQVGLNDRIDRLPIVVAFPFTVLAPVAGFWSCVELYNIVRKALEYSEYKKLNSSTLSK